MKRTHNKEQDSCILMEGSGFLVAVELFLDGSAKKTSGNFITLTGEGVPRRARGWDVATWRDPNPAVPGQIPQRSEVILKDRSAL